jgi:hypothetical protein
VGNDVDLIEGHSVGFGQDLRPLERHHDEAVAETDQLFHHLPLRRVRIAEDRVQGRHHRHAHFLEQGQQVATGHASVDPELVLDAEHLRVVEVQIIGDTAVTVEVALENLRPHLRRVAVTFLAIVHRDRITLGAGRLGGDGALEIGREGRDPAAPGLESPRNAIRFSGGDSINDLSQGDYDRVRSATQPFSVQPFSGLTSRASSGHHSRMNPTSLTFAIGMASLVALTGWFIDWGAGKPGVWSIRKRRIARIVTVLATVIVGIYVYRSDVPLEGHDPLRSRRPLGRKRSPDLDRRGRTSRHRAHPHDLSLHPRDSTAPPARSPCGRGSERRAVRRPHRSDLCPRNNPSLGQECVRPYTWVDVTHSFTPPRAGVHELLVESVDGVVPVNLHLRITDPEKRDGKRAPGY